MALEWFPTLDGATCSICGTRMVALGAAHRVMERPDPVIIFDGNVPDRCPTCDPRDDDLPRGQWGPEASYP